MWQQIRHFAALGKSRCAIAQELCLLRNSVAAALARDHSPRYTRQASAPAPEPWQEAVAAGVRRGLSGARLL